MSRGRLFLRGLMPALSMAVMAPDSGWAAGANDASAQPEVAPAKVGVSGMGWYRNRKLRETLRLLEPDDETMSEIDAAYIEDSVVLLQSALDRDGFLRPQGFVVVRRDGETLGEFSWEAGTVPEIPREILADHVVFALEPGVRYHFRNLEFSGLASISASDARAYFLEEGLLFGGAGARRFTPAVLQSGAANLREQLVRLGHADATVQVAAEERDPETGAVDVTIAVAEGMVHRVAAVVVPAGLPEAVQAQTAALAAGAADAVYSPLWQQDFVQAVRTLYYKHGYARAGVDLAPTDFDTEGDEVRRGFELTIEPGLRIRVGEVRFAGDDRTSQRVLRRAVEVEPGDLYDRSRIDQDRLRLGGLGVFSSVRAEADETAADEASGEETWDLTYRLRPGKQLEVSVLAGYGSYEQLRGGIEVAHANHFGRAHRGRLKLVQSQRATYGDYLYTIPQIFGTTTDASARVFGLNREEVSFDRREIGASVGVRRYVDFIGADVSLRYQYEFLSEDDTLIGNVTLDVTRERLDNPIAPRRGYILAATLETASQVIGSEVDYQRLDLRAAWHHPVGDERHVHLGFRHGLIWTTGEASVDVPVERRLFPGGEGTIRGYREGRASPRDNNGQYSGAEVSTVLNVEIEQGLAPQLSVVAFVDAGLTAVDLGDYPGNERRVSVGLGLRYDTVIGPARLEYGHNVVREAGDAVGQWHFALGFPF